MSSRASELLLIVFLVAIVGLTRVYYGAAQGPMFVWKGEFSYKDTIVDLPEFIKSPRAKAMADHPKIVYQLEEMGLIDEDEQFKHRKHRLHLPGQSSEHSGLNSAPVDAHLPTSAIEIHKKPEPAVPSQLAPTGQPAKPRE